MREVSPEGCRTRRGRRTTYRSRHSPLGAPAGRRAEPTARRRDTVPGDPGHRRPRRTDSAGPRRRRRGAGHRRADLARGRGGGSGGRARRSAAGANGLAPQARDARHWFPAPFSAIFGGDRGRRTGALSGGGAAGTRRARLVSRREPAPDTNAELAREDAAPCERDWRTEQSGAPRSVLIVLQLGRFAPTEHGVQGSHDGRSCGLQ